MNYSRANPPADGTGKRGFVGPLGDDIPSIFPIVLGVVLFLTSLTFASSLVAQKNTRLEVTNAALKLGYVVTDHGVLDDGTFASDCRTVYTPTGEGQRVFFRVTLTRFCSYYNSAHDPYNENVTASEVNAPSGQNQPGAACTNALPDRPIRDPVTLQYPIAVPCPQKGSSRLGVGMINIIAWR